MSLRLILMTMPNILACLFASIIFLASLVKISHIIIYNEPLGLPAEYIWLLLFLIYMLPALGPQNYQAGYQAGWRCGWGTGKDDLHEDEVETPKTRCPGDWQAGWSAEWRDGWRAGLKVGWQAGWQYESNRLGILHAASIVPEAGTGSKASISPITSIDAEVDVNLEDELDGEIRFASEVLQQLSTGSKSQSKAVPEGKRWWSMRNWGRRSKA